LLCLLFNPEYRVTCSLKHQFVFHQTTRHYVPCRQNSPNSNVKYLILHSIPIWE
jgi:hypothetical protein